MNVIDLVVKKGWCVGCGMCAALCPKNRLEMRWNEYGEYNPSEIDGCDKCHVNCSVCYKACPAHGNTKNETELGKQCFEAVDGIRYKKETGFYLSSYVGFSGKHRSVGASGGMGTWTLERLLEIGKIDAAAVVGRTFEPEKLFEFKLCATVDELRSCSRSAYYPVEISSVVKKILRNDRRYAFIGLPCVCKALRLAQEKFPRLQKRIPYVLGLTCGHQCSKFFAEYVCAVGGGDPHQLREIVFRTKDLTQPASNHGITFRSGSGKNEVKKQVLWRDGINVAYNNGYFQIPGCFYCDDVFAECADMTFMDAWLPEYAKDPKGTSLVLVRNEKLNKIINEGRKKDNLVLEEIQIDELILSQKGVLDRKRVQKTYNVDIPKMREKIVKKPSFFISDVNIFYRKISNITAIIWKQNKTLLSIKNAVFPLEKKIFFKKKKNNVVLLPCRLINKINSMLGMRNNGK